MSATLNIHVNGQPRQVHSGFTVTALLGELKVAQPHVAVELNLEVVPRTRHAETLLKEGDHVEVVTLVGGG